MYIEQAAPNEMTDRKRYKVMTNIRDQKTNPSQPVVYQIRLKGHLDLQWTDWFEGLTITLGEAKDICLLIITTIVALDTFLIYLVVPVFQRESILTRWR